jgi:hypothetical protein
VETTSLDARDRIAELTVLRGDGGILDEYATVADPATAGTSRRARSTR